MPLSRRAVLISSVSSTLVGRFARADSPTIRIGVLRFGAAAWELDVMRRHGFDKAQGIAVEQIEFASAQATQVALQAGRVDIVLLDWLWVVGQRARGADWTFAPSSGAVGAIVAPPGSPVKTVRDLPGARVGIAGSPIDKSWLILQAYGARKLGLDLDHTVKKSFGAPPLLTEELNAGRLDAALTFWPFAAKAEVAGMRRILGVEEMVRDLGVAAPLPFVGYVFSSAWADRNRTAVNGFLTAGQRARELLDTSDEEWRLLAPAAGATSEAELDALKNAYRRGVIPAWGDAERAAIGQLYQILFESGVLAPLDAPSAIPPGVFW